MRIIGGIEDLIEFMEVFKGMNLFVTNKGQLNIKHSKNSWIRDEPIDWFSWQETMKTFIY